MNDAQTRASFVPAIIQATLADRNVAVWYTLIFLAPWPTTVLDRRPRLSHQIVVATTPNSAPPSVDATRDIQPSLPKPVILLRIHRTASYTLKTCRRNYESALLRRPHYALHPDHPSVPFPVTAVNPRKRKTIQRSHSQKRLPTSEITGRTILRSKGQSWISLVAGKEGCVGHWNRTYLSHQVKMTGYKSGNDYTMFFLCHYCAILCLI